MHPPKITFLRLLLLAVLVNILAQAIHETGHLLVYQAYRRSPTWGFIGIAQLWGVQPIDPEGWVKTSAPDGEIGWLRLGSPQSGKIERALSAAAGPLASLLSALIGLWLAAKSDRPGLRAAGLMLALLVSFVMGMYYLRSPLRSIGDEYDIAMQLGIAKAAVEIPFGLAFAACFVLGLRLLEGGRQRLKWIAAILMGGIPSGLLLSFADGWVRTMVNQGSPFVQPVLGYALPVLLVYLAALAGLAVIQAKWPVQP